MASKPNKFESLVGKSWYPILKSFFESDEFKEIADTLKGYKEKGITVQPDFHDAFASFRNCPLDDMKVVLIMEIGKNKAENEKIANAIGKAIHDDTKNVIANLWKTTECLLLPLNLTAGGLQSHTNLWKPFIFHVLKAIRSKPGLIYCFVGKSSRNHWLAVDESINDRYYVEHPMQAIMNNREWNHEQVFEKINRASRFLNDKQVW